MLQPASVDIRLDARFRIFSNHLYSCIDPRESQEGLTELVEVGAGAAFVLHPGEFVLGATVECVTLGSAHVARLEGKSSLGRLGLMCHATAGWIDPGFSGHITLELSNVANLPIRVYPGMPIGQLSFAELSSPAGRPYGAAGTSNRYQGQAGPTESRMWQHFEQEPRGQADGQARDGQTPDVQAQDAQTPDVQAQDAQTPDVQAADVQAQEAGAR